MSDHLPLEVIYATNEDLAVRAVADYDDLAPRDQLIAAGGDGVVAAGGWTLSSASVDFGARGVKRHDVVRLWGNRNTIASGRFGGESSGQWFAVESADGNTLTLRRKGERAGYGEPVGAPAQQINIVQFMIPTLAPQIERASRDLNRRFGIDPRGPRRPSDLYDLDDLREACELTVLHKLYLAVTRRASDDVWKVKAKEYSDELDAVLARLAIRWGPTGDDRPATVRVGRVSR